MPEPLSQAELAKLATGLRRILDAIAKGEVTASSGTVSRLEGAWLVVETLAKGRILDISELFDIDPPADV